MDTNNMNQDQNQQPVYQQPVYQQPYQSDVEPPVSVGEWMLTMLLMAIPCVNIIMLFVWAFGSGAPKSKSNWAKASLIWIAIAIVLEIVIWATVGASLISQYGGY